MWDGKSQEDVREAQTSDWQRKGKIQTVLIAITFYAK